MRELAKLRQEKLEQLGKGVDFESYRFWLGYLKAFEDFTVLLAELKKREDDNGKF
jgi:hypothetical protein